MVVLEENPAGAANWAEERQPDWRRADDVKSLVSACRTGVRFRRANLASSVIEKLPWRQGRSDSVLPPRGDGVAIEGLGLPRPQQWPHRESDPRAD